MLAERGAEQQEQRQDHQQLAAVERCLDAPGLAIGAVPDAAAMDAAGVTAAATAAAGSSRLLVFIGG